VIVVSASGNNGNAPYITSSPGAGNGGLAVAANDPTASFPAATLSLSTGPTLTAIDANGYPITAGTYPLHVIWGNAAHTTISIGCSVAQDNANGSSPAGAIIVVARGTCARVAKAIFGQQAGAIGVVMVNNSSAFPPFEGKITGDPDPPGPPLFGGFQYTVTIPFLGVRGGSNPSNSANGVALRAANGGTVTLAGTTIANPGFKALASFSSYGPSAGGLMKPQVTAPGVSIASAGIGTGTEAIIESGTSMATPHTSGMAALVKQAHPGWKKVAYWNAAIVDTADSAGVSNYTTRGGGTGLIQAYPATHTQVVGTADPDNATTVNFGLTQNGGAYTDTGTIHLRNFGGSAATFTATATHLQGDPHTVTLSPSTVTVPANGSADVSVSISVPSGGADPISAFNNWWGAGQFGDVAGLISFAPSGGDNSGIGLNVPYYGVPTLDANAHATLNATQLAKTGVANATITNDHGAFGVADWFAWAATDSKASQKAAIGAADVLNVGVQTYPASVASAFCATAQCGAFAIQTAHPWTNPAEEEFDVLVDVNGDGTPDYDVVAVDFGALTAGSANGEDVVAVISEVTGAASIRYLAGGMFNGSTMELQFDFDQLCQSGTPCVSPTTPITYQVFSFDRNGGSDSVASIPPINLFAPVFSNNFEDVVPAGSTATDTTTLNSTNWAATPQLGLLVIEQNDQHNGNQEAETIPVSH
jgi:hypothetical protein